jgi:hypothetical protein
MFLNKMVMYLLHESLSYFYSMFFRDNKPPERLLADIGPNATKTATLGYFLAQKGNAPAS